MPEIEQAEYDNLKTEAAKVSGLETERTELTAKVTSATDEATGSAAKLVELSKISDEQINKTAASDVELTKLRADKEAWAKTEEEGKKFKEERDTFEKEVTTFRTSQIDAARGRLHTLGVKEDDTKDKDITILQAMEAGAALVGGGQPPNGKPNNPGVGAGLNGGEGNPAVKGQTALEQNLEHIKKLRENSRSRGQKIG